MNEQEIFPSWGDLDDGKESVWSADWTIDLDQEKSSVFLTMIYKDSDEFIWYYDEIKKAFDEKIIKDFVNRYLNDVSEDDIKELEEFFFHWLMIVDAGGNVDMNVDDSDVIEVDIDDQ